MKMLTPLFKHSFASFLMLLASLQVIAGPKTHFLVKTYNLEEMVTASENIFVGQLVNSREDYIYAAGGEIPITIYTFKVDEALKGAIGITLTIRQVGHRSNPSSLFGHSTPLYKKGEVLMIFFAGESEIGLTSPVGMGQGVFRVKTDRGAKVSVTNERKNLGLLEGSERIQDSLETRSPDAQRRLKTSAGDIPYGDFRDLVLELMNP